MENSPFPNTEAIVSCLNLHFGNLTNNPIEVPSDGTLYGIEQQFGMVCNSWKDKLQSVESFGPTTEANILYRSEIANELFTKVKKALKIPRTGIMVKGPLGIGKSHSLVNLVLMLQSTGNCLVTFVPDCSVMLESKESLLKAICASFGIEVHGAGGIGMPNQPLSEFQHATAMTRIVDEISRCLRNMEKTWVFVFDQINAIFRLRPDAHSIMELGYPMCFIESVMTRHGNISVISGSANNEIDFLNCHIGFDAFDHVREMSDDELMMVFGKKA